MIRIIPLRDRPDAVPLVAGWELDQWGHHNPSITPAKLEARLREQQPQDAIPTTLLALDDADTPVGTASLVAEDIQGDPRTPWLASVYVTPAARGRGIASALVGAVEVMAARLGIERLYLFTPDQQRLYARLGWRKLERTAYRGEEIQVMDKELRGKR